ncbi:uncharacterized protein LOC131615719 [Vicia villosa]|uniref:uncharacterized protein LOC131615719 n=1 Tax=Vicia villosa TaxID=3911 RepID=UPI00273BA197|nr:uncharacterized protein LOC131615719 [Vicia villosa]
MNIQSKIESGSSPKFVSTNPNNFEDKTIQDLVSILCNTRQYQTFDRVEGVLVSRDTSLREEIQRLREKVDWEKQKLYFERLSRSQAEVNYRKREELHEKEKRRLQESYEFLLKEVEKLKEKCVNDGKDAEHSLGVGASIQPQSKGKKVDEGTSSGRGTMKVGKNIEIINLEDDDDDEHQGMARGVYANPIDMVKRKIDFSDSDSSSSSSSSDDSSFLDNLRKWSAVPHAKKMKM